MEVQIQRIGSYEAYQEAVERYRKKAVFSNAYFLKSAVLEMIERESLYDMEWEGNLYLFRREEGFFRLFYYIGNVEIRERIPLSAPMIVEFVYQEEMQPKKQEEAAFLKKLGFRLGRHSCRLELKGEAVVCEDTDSAMKASAVAYAEETETDRINTLLRETFNPMYAYIPSLEELRKMIMDREILVVRQEGAVAGVLHFEMQKGNMMLWQIAVDPRFRGRGLGRCLLDGWHSIYKDSVKAFVLWTDAENDRAIQMYTAAGYQPDGRYADEYILARDDSGG